MKSLTIVFIMVYVLLSLPAMLGMGYVIDWVPEATLLQKVKGYVISGLTNDYLFKMIVSLILSVYIQPHFYSGLTK